MSTKKRAAGNNAFDMLMGKKTKTLKSSQKSSRFVDCPVGCGAHVPEHQLNSHLDTCLGGSTSKAAGGECAATTPKTETTKTENQDTQENTMNLSDTQKAPASTPKQAPASAKVMAPPESLESESTRLAAAATIPVSQSPETRPDAFSHMMKQSHKVFSAKEPLRQRFHLHSDGRLSWTTDDMDSWHENDESWSATVLLKGSRMMQGGVAKNAIQPRDVELTISSSIPSAASPKRLVRRHSRLSVPVLKSILQKSVRRRRPLPAVRVAMELMDKAMGELLRRLPIIILEDSTLHPDLPLLVWAMVAESKDYVVPPQLMTRILCIVYEMASCPWTDYIGDESHDTVDEPIVLSSPLLFEEANVKEPNGCEVLLRSILLRAQYGGMAGDMKMLHGYVHLWNKRFQEESVPLIVAQRASPNADSSAKMSWIDVPTAIHERPKLQSDKHVAPLIQQGLDKLVFQDICLAGVDFHCSSVLDQAIRDVSDYERCYESLCRVAVRAGLSPLPTNKEKQRTHLMQVMKSCMWKYSSGINHRRPLVGEATKPADGKEAALKSFWEENVASSVENYTKQYVGERLAR